MNYNKGDIVVVKFPFFTREKEMQKGRPAMVISNTAIKTRYDDYILAAITSQVPSETMELEIKIKPDSSNGLVKESLLRLDFIMTIPAELISRKIGSLSEKILDEADRK
ncbi:MAG: type II toxin-antitoxin system PemK/MazF family toxin [bacterium]